MADQDPLARYNAKRDFSKTAEPRGEFAPGNGISFMVQKHDATRLHWDFRLEVDGVLKSWAVTRGPSLDPDEKRLAVRTEDHPLSYATFEGTIPKGEYGGGTVMLWDRGTWAPVPGKSAKDLEKGHLHFTLNGERMKGEWLLIRLKPRRKERNENWLLRKINDAEAGGTDTLTEEALTSVATGRTMQEIAENKPAKAKGKAAPAKAAAPKRVAKSSSRAGKPPAFKPLQLCTLVDAVPAGNGWLHEIKYDGYRALIAVGGGSAKVYTRSGLDWTDKFPGIAEVAAALPVNDALIDGEIVAYKDGRPDFSTLKDAISNNGPMTLFAFDLLQLDGEDLTKLPNVARKERLRPLVSGDDPRLQFADHVVGAGEKLFETMCREGLEGVVSKRADAPYRGDRTSAWLKAKCIQRQEFVIVGWTASDNKRGFRSLLLGVHRDGQLQYAGKVGTGFGHAQMDELLDAMEPLARDTPTVVGPKNLGRAAVRGARWIEPKLVAEIAYAEVTPDGVLRHSSFLGLRGDKPAADVVVETPTPPPAAPEIHVKVSSREREIFPDSTVTKGELADYYAQVAPIMLPWVANRPISLVRCPQGRGKRCFFQKHDAGSFGEWVHQVPVTEKDGSSEDYLYVTDADGLVACVQMGTIEFHGWGSTVDHLEQPDRMVFDLDPDEGLDFAVTRDAAAHLRDLLGEMGLTTFPLLSGGKGVHVVVPLTPRADWPAVRDFSERFARALEQADPARFVANMSKARRKGRIFVDYLRNGRGSTAIMPYAARARAGAPVAVPVSWTELRDMTSAHPFCVRDGAELLKRANGRGLQGWGVADQVLPDL
ncbi:DNA ligase D [Sphingomonas aerophila]|uniref:DNA ligase (ATP) n=1 Tax=Sphingomonas aerophila TaxID=1344948 RepID=A0A7W9BAG0_9SPHN|nr:DNA ligase D [Sphingomonas aerophila]MBB5713246.1 bifunctional non-homologous end joining protein LigD [Sphingomonas aerophila]